MKREKKKRMRIFHIAMSIILVFGLVNIGVASARILDRSSDEFAKQKEYDDGSQYLWVKNGSSTVNFTLSDTISNNHKSYFKVDGSPDVALLEIGYNSYDEATYQGNRSKIEDFDLTSEESPLWLNYSDNDYWVNLSLDDDGTGDPAYINVTLKVSGTYGMAKDITDIMATLVPLVVIIVMISIFVGAIASIRFGGGGW